MLLVSLSFTINLFPFLLLKTSTRRDNKMERMIFIGLIIIKEDRSEPINVMPFHVLALSPVNALNFHTRGPNPSILSQTFSYNSPEAISQQRFPMPLIASQAKNLKCWVYHFSKWFCAVRSRRPTHIVLVFFNVIIAYCGNYKVHESLASICTPLQVTTGDTSRYCFVTLYYK